MLYFALFGAFERYNYGDLLFPNILEKLLKPKFPDAKFIFLGLVESDLTSLGGKKTEAVHSLSQLTPTDRLVLIHVGGEVLGCPAEYALGADLPQPVAGQLLKMSMHLQSDVIARILLNLDFSFPYMLSKKILRAEGSFVVFNSVGGVLLNLLSDEQKVQIKSRLRSADVVAVRDIETKKNLENLGIDAELFPDCAVLISDLFYQEVRKILNSDWFKKDYSNPYVVLQVNGNLSDGELLQLSLQTKLVNEKLGYKIILLPIGTASFHEDHRALSKLNQLMGKPPWCEIIDCPDIFTTMAMIAGSKLFAGTSLHGFITASSFAVHRLGFSEFIPKLKHYSNTWETRLGQTNSSYGSFYTDVVAALKIPKEDLAEVARKNKHSYNRFFSDLEKKIESFCNSPIIPNDTPLLQVSEEELLRSLKVTTTVDSIIGDYKQQLGNLEMKARGLEQELSGIKNSRGWRLLAKLKKIKTTFIRAD